MRASVGGDGLSDSVCDVMEGFSYPKSTTRRCEYLGTLGSQTKNAGARLLWIEDLWR